MIWIRVRYGFCYTILKLCQKSIFITVFMSCHFSCFSMAWICYISIFLVMWVKRLSSANQQESLNTQRPVSEIKSQSPPLTFAITSCITESYLKLEKVAETLHWFWELQPRRLRIYVYADIRFSFFNIGFCPCSVKTWQIDNGQKWAQWDV